MKLTDGIDDAAGTARSRPETSSCAVHDSVAYASTIASLASHPRPQSKSTTSLLHRWLLVDLDSSCPSKNKKEKKAFL